MKRATILIWISSVLLGANHLMFLAGDQRQPDFWVFTGALLFCYSVPFVALLMIRIPENPSAGRYMILTSFIVVFIISILLPIRRFLPGYRPAELEGLAYFFLPIVESGLVALALGGDVIIRLFRKDDLQS